MTAMPQMVAIYNGMGGGAAGAIAAVELFGNKGSGTTQLVVTLLGALIGAISLSGSLIAWAKLQGVIKKPLRARGQQYFNIYLYCWVHSPSRAISFICRKVRPISCCRRRT